ncbi:hypothetical protein [Phytohabitans houttuyneae]|uniref:Uncharacterized protein n=1 Tax=Phytohabitans houttuyneae TaxID=1076126 RepID=A0A6V8KAE4_9ACTN|nr:hypothetical protein [Phytohabitans houttuyneae]GFJ79431.1 hypothetical protein Phou_036110 [Phytohabitans houttuyneae]
MNPDLEQLRPDLRALAEAILAEAAANPHYRIADLIRASGVSTWEQQCLLDALVGDTDGETR